MCVSIEIARRVMVQWGRHNKNFSRTGLSLSLSVPQHDKLSDKDLLAPCPTPLLAVRDLLFNKRIATLHIGGRSSLHNLRTRHAVVTGTQLSRWDSTLKFIITKYFLVKNTLKSLLTLPILLVNT
jgi:hypothetical protein